MSALPRDGSSPAVRQGSRRTRPAARPPRGPGRAAPGVQERLQRWGGDRGKLSTMTVPRRQMGAPTSASSPKNSSSANAAGRPGAGSRRRRIGPAWPAPGIRSSGPGHHVEDVVDIVDGARDQADAVQRFAGRHQPDGAQQSAGRFEPDHPVERRGHPARAGGVGRDRERHLAQRDRQRGARTGAARDQLATEHAARHRVWRSGAVEPGGELVEIASCRRKMPPASSRPGPPARCSRPHSA